MKLTIIDINKDKNYKKKIRHWQKTAKIDDEIEIREVPENTICQNRFIYVKIANNKSSTWAYPINYKNNTELLDFYDKNGKK